MAVVVGTVTDLARQYWPQFFGTLLGITSGASVVGNWNPLFRSFKIGRGGWVDPGTGKVPRTPDPTFTDLDVILDYGRAAPAKRYTSLTGNIMFVEKSLVTTDFTYVAPSTISINCLLDFPDFNDIQGTPSNPPGGGVLAPSGVNPDLYEIGIFSDHPSGVGKLMVIYGTFNAETKTNAKQISNVVKLNF